MLTFEVNQGKSKPSQVTRVTIAEGGVNVADESKGTGVKYGMVKVPMEFMERLRLMQAERRHGGKSATLSGIIMEHLKPGFDKEYMAAVSAQRDRLQKELDQTRTKGAAA